MIANDKACALSGCDDGNEGKWCEVTAVCQLVEDKSVYMMLD